MGNLLYHAHKAFQRFGQWWSTPSDDPIIKAIHSRAAYAKWQRQVREEIASARAKHGRIREIERRRTQTLHAALAANRNHGAPGHG